ncbi:hypothetical protein, partial [Vibrio navarrensis]|uniref:hypothetical protein n=1 Tax=Vibrio navarrensis TaxID=29495 RepID=UPI001D04D015
AILSRSTSVIKTLLLPRFYIDKSDTTREILIPKSSSLLAINRSSGIKEINLQNHKLENALPDCV